LSSDHYLLKHVFSAWTLKYFVYWMAAKNTACIAGDAPPWGPARFSTESAMTVCKKL
jgi:hypothetical protein